MITVRIMYASPVEHVLTVMKESMVINVSIAVVIIVKMDYAIGMVHVFHV